MLEEGRGFSKERRFFSRIKTNFPAKFLDLAQGKEVKAKTCDVSAQGVGMITKEKLEESVPLKIWLHFPDKKKPLNTQGRVAWVKEESLGNWRIGIRLDEPEFLGMSRIFRM